MAEGLLRHLTGNRLVAYSAGIEATHVRPQALRVMGELGIDISGQESKTLDRYLGEPFDYVITVCDDAKEACPFFPGAAQRLHWSLPDPAAAEGTEDERLEVFRSVRDRPEGPNGRGAAQRQKRLKEERLRASSYEEADPCQPSGE
jgi:arsenate reductase